MKGIVFSLFEQSITAEHGPDLWDDLLEATGLSGAYTSLGDYPDEHLPALLEAASQSLGAPAADLERWLGRRSMAPLSQQYPAFFEPHQTTLSFVLTLNDIIHPEVRKLYPGADVPVFGFSPGDGAELTLTYHSARQMCAFAEGLIEGAAAHYGERVRILRPSCMKHGAQLCTLVCLFERETALA